jgi:hypothetical protein
MREASGGAEKLVAIEIRLTNSACNTKTAGPTGLETLSTPLHHRRAGRGTLLTRSPPSGTPVA